MKSPIPLELLDGDGHKRSLLLFVENTKKEIESIRMAAYKDRVFKKPLIGLLDQYIRMVNSFYSKYRVQAEKETDKKKLQQQIHKAIMKLATEWDYVFRLTSAARARGRELKWLRPVIHQAILDIGLDINSFVVLPHFGHEFMLTSFEYAPSTVVLGVPVFNIYTPWEWSVIWHELAGRKVKELKGRGVFKEIISNSNITEAKKWTEWAEELFEDGCSILAFGEDSLPIFERILTRYDYSEGGDARHPSSVDRIWFANYLLGKQSVDNAGSQTLATVALKISALLEKECPNLKQRSDTKSIILTSIQQYHDGGTINAEAIADSAVKELEKLQEDNSKSQEVANSQKLPKKFEQKITLATTCEELLEIELSKNDPFVCWLHGTTVSVTYGNKQCTVKDCYLTC